LSIELKLPVAPAPVALQLAPAVVFTPKRVRLLNIACFLAILLYALWYTTSFQIRHQSLSVSRLIDYGLNYEQSLVVARDLAYPQWTSGFLYPPPNVVLRIGLAKLGLGASAILWMGLLIASTIFCLRASLSLLGLSQHPARYVMALLALSSVEYFIEWDLRALNGNMIYLAALLGTLTWVHRARPVGAGFLLACSIVLKVYSIVLLPYFLFKRQYRLCLSAGLWLVMFFVVLPALSLGPENAWRLSESWVTTVLSSCDSRSLPFEYPAYLTSLHKTLLILLNEKAGRGIFNILMLQEDQIFTITRWGQAVWVMLLGLYVLVQRRYRATMSAGRALMMDAGVLTLVMLPFSPALQPHHGVVMLIPAILLVSQSFDVAAPKGVRWSSAMMLLACYVELQFGPSLALRGLGMMLCIVVLMSALIFLRTLPSHHEVKPAL
jgi:hypothetical protein